MIMESGFSSPRSDAFPSGLRVLVVDDDLTWLKILEKMLKKCSYEVTTCGRAWDALKLLRDRKDGFDIVISDVNMPDMDGFKLLEHVGLEMDLPVIMMSVDGETSRVMKGVQHGACDYLLKPIRMKELKNIWQHVVRKRMHEMKDIEYLDDRNGSDPSNDGCYSGDHTSFRKRKDADNKHDEKESIDSASTKKARVVWTVELHQKFVKAVNQIGIDSDKVGPKKILDLMNVPRLTRENVASHLQKYRLYLSRIRRGDKIESCFGGMKNSESSGGCSLPNSTYRQQNDANGDLVYPGKQLSVGIVDCKPLDTDLKSSSLTPLTEQKPLNNETSDPHKASTSKVGLDRALGSLGTSIKCTSFDSPVSGRYPWIAEAPDVQFESEFKPHSSLEYCFNQPTLSIVQQHNPPDLLDPAPTINRPGPSISDSDLIDVKPLNVKPGRNDIKQLPPIEGALGSFSVSNSEPFGCIFDMALDVKNQNSTRCETSINEEVPRERSIQSFPLHPTNHLSNEQGLDRNFDITSDVNNQSCDQGSTIFQGSVLGLESDQRSQLLAGESAFGLLGEDLMFYWLQSGGGGLMKDLEFDNLGFSDFNFPEHVCEVPVPRLGLDYDPYPFDCVECPVDQGVLFS